VTRTLTRRPGRAATAALVATLALGLSGCGDDDPGESTDDPTTGAPSTSSSSPTSSDSPTESQSTESQSPSVTPATGIELTEETSSLRLPDGWEPAEPLVDWASGADGPNPYDSFQLSDRPSLAGDTTLDSLAQSAMEVLPKGVDAERLPDIDLAGSPAYVITFTEAGIPAVNYDIATLRNGRSISIDVILDKKTVKQDPQLLESVLASFRWLD
jgi:hypothetical protein